MSGSQEVQQFIFILIRLIITHSSGGFAQSGKSTGVISDGVSSFSSMMSFFDLNFKIFV